MGLASKMAAAGGAAAAYAGGQPGAPPYPTQQQQYQAYPGGAQQPPQQYGQQPPRPGYGAPPPTGYPPQMPGQGAYGAPQGQLSPESFRQSLQQTIAEKNVGMMFQNPQILDQICQAAPSKVEQLCQQWKVPREVGQDIAKLGLFDIILYVDDSGSMQFEENGERIQDLKLILAKAAFAASLFDADGISVRFMNSTLQGNNIRSEPEVEALISQIQFKGMTPMGTQLRAKVLDPLVVQPARSNQLRKPVLVITITDGQPAGEANGAVFEAIRYASNELSRTPYGKGAVSFEFAQVGNDLKAREFLAKLDNEPGIGELVDSTSNFEVEQDEMARATPPVDLTPDLWLLKLLLGAIDSSYDTKDEAGSRPGGFAPPAGGYHPPGGQYPPQGQQPYSAPGGQHSYSQQPPYAQQGQYGQPPSQYGQPPSQYGQPPQGQYGQSQYGQPPAGQYGQPPSQYGQPPQGQYGAPPPGQPGYPPPAGTYPGQQQYKPPPRY